jgi:hypothetical protein
MDHSLPSDYDALSHGGILQYSLGAPTGLGSGLQYRTHVSAGDDSTFQASPLPLPMCKADPAQDVRQADASSVSVPLRPLPLRSGFHPK